MDASVATGRGGSGCVPTVRRVSQFAEPRPDSGERAHEAARPQQLPAQAPARGQKAVQPLLRHFVHVHEAVRCPTVERAVLDVLTDDSGALFVAAAEKPAAVVTVRRGLALGLIIMPVHRGSPSYPNLQSSPWAGIRF